MDRDLVVRAKGGDRDAFAHLAAAAITRFDAVARMITRDPWVWSHNPAVMSVDWNPELSCP